MHALARTPTQHPLATLIAAAWAIFALHAVGVLGPHGSALFDAWTYCGLLTVAAAACAARARSAPRERAAWLLMGAAICAWALGEAYLAIDVAPGAQHPSDWPAEALRLAFYPLAYAALVILVRQRADLTRRDLWLDGAIGATCAAGVTTAIALPVLSIDPNHDLATAVDLAYPVLDFVLLGFAVVVLSLAGWRPGPRWIMIGAALALMAATDTALVAATAGDRYATGHLLDALWPASALLIALGAWQSSGDSGAPLKGAGRQVVVPVFCGSLALAVVALGALGALGAVEGQPVMLAFITLSLVVVRIATAFSEAQRTLLESRRQAMTDLLTGLGNRRRLLIDLAQVTDGVATADSPWACVLLDLDGFKAYNDAFGHPAGDELLSRLGDRLSRVADGGAAYRLGGDEFCLLAPCPVAELPRLVARARAALAESGEAFSVTSSSGAVVIPDDADDAAATLQVADRRMYADKGRRGSSAGHQSRAVLLRILREREPDLHEHLVGVAELAVAVGRELGLRGEELDELARAAELHDIGKIAIPEEILDKADTLTSDEWAFVRRHTVIGERILMAAPALRPVARLVRSSHERYDGGGYPDGLRGEEIPLGARIVAVCDAFEAMVSERPYRAALSPEQAIAELQRNSSTQFDPYVVEVFADALDERVEGAPAAAALVRLG